MLRVLAIAIAWALAAPMLNAVDSTGPSATYDGLLAAQLTVRVQNTCVGVDPERLLRRFAKALITRGQMIEGAPTIPPHFRTGLVTVSIYCIPVGDDHLMYSSEVQTSRLAVTPERRWILATVHIQRVLRLVPLMHLAHVAGEDLEDMAEVVAARLAAVNQKMTKKV